MSARHLLSFAAALGVAACQDQAGDIGPDPGPATIAPSASATAPSPTPLADGTAAAKDALPLEPQPMQLSEWRGADLRGDLGCGFARAVGEPPLLFAASFVDEKATTDAALKLDGKVIRLTTETRGGFDALSQGARFAGPDGLYANLVRTGARIAETPRIAEESPRYPALLVVSRAGRELSIDGIWECGP